MGTWWASSGPGSYPALVGGTRDVFSGIAVTSVFRFHCLTDSLISSFLIHGQDLITAAFVPTCVDRLLHLDRTYGGVGERR